MHTRLTQVAPTMPEPLLLPKSNLEDNPLSTLIHIITHAIDAEKIYLLGSYPAPPDGSELEYDLLILVNDTGNRPMDQLESLIQNRSLNTVPVFVTVFRTTYVNHLIATGNSFFIKACSPENLVYNAGRISLSTPGETCNASGCCEQSSVYNSFMAHAEAFLQGATNYAQKEEYALACFMLHQTVEQALSALLVPLMNFHLKTHNLGRLLRITRRFSTDIYNVFPRTLKQDAQLFSMLQRAYIHGRYSNNFSVSAENTETLIERCTQLLQLVENAFTKHVNNSTIAAA